MKLSNNGGRASHPVGLRWPRKEKEHGAKLIHVDPGFTRTSALCDIYVPIRAGTDIAFRGGLINYVLTNERWFREYVLAYTNATTLVEEGFVDVDQVGAVLVRSCCRGNDCAYNSSVKQKIVKTARSVLTLVGGLALKWSLTHAGRGSAVDIYATHEATASTVRNPWVDSGINKQ